MGSVPKLHGRLPGDRANAALVLAARNVEKLENLAIELRQLGSSVLVVPTDVKDRTACIDLINKTVSAFGCIDTLDCECRHVGPRQFC